LPVLNPLFAIAWKDVRLISINGSSVTIVTAAGEVHTEFASPQERDTAFAAWCELAPMQAAVCALENSDREELNPSFFEKVGCITPPIFWAEISPCEHLVQVYVEESPFLDALTGFVAGGIRADEGVVVIATSVHRRALEVRLQSEGIDLDLAAKRDNYIPLDADETLAKFMTGPWPDEGRFTKVVADVLERARRGGRRVRAFGEMVALLWAKGQYPATVRLEQLWHECCHKGAFSLFCAYPRSGFTQDPHSSIQQICAAHTKVFYDQCGHSDRMVRIPA
jgi:hypothetical protein